MSISTFRKFCLRNFRKSPGELLNDIRMSKARAMLIYSGQNIDSIAANCGYANRFAFSKAFRRLNGISPRTLQGKIRPLTGNPRPATSATLCRYLVSKHFLTCSASGGEVSRLTTISDKSDNGNA